MSRDLLMEERISNTFLRQQHSGRTARPELPSPSQATVCGYASAARGGKGCACQGKTCTHLGCLHLTRSELLSHLLLSLYI